MPEPTERKTPLTDDLLARHKEETRAIPDNATYGEQTRHAVKQVKELIEHTRSLETALACAEERAGKGLPLLYNVWCMGTQERDKEWEYQWRQLMQAIELELTSAGYKPDAALGPGKEKSNAG